MDLAVGNLRDHTSGGLELSVGDLRDGDAGRGSLELAIGDLRDSTRSLGLAVRKLGCTATGSLNSLDMDLIALCAGILAVQIVKSTRQTLVEHSGATETQ